MKIETMQPDGHKIYRYEKMTGKEKRKATDLDRMKDRANGF